MQIFLWLYAATFFTGVAGWSSYKRYHDKSPTIPPLSINLGQGLRLRVSRSSHPGRSFQGLMPLLQWLTSSPVRAIEQMFGSCRHFEKRPLRTLHATLSAPSSAGQQLKVLELGAALALPSLTLALLGHNVIASDVLPALVRGIREHARLNDISTQKLQAIRLDWMQIGADGRHVSSSLQQQFDLALCWSPWPRTSFLAGPRYGFLMRRALRRLLKPSGLLLLSSHTVFLSRPEKETRDFRLASTALAALLCDFTLVDMMGHRELLKIGFTPTGSPIDWYLLRLNPTSFRNMTNFEHWGIKPGPNCTDSHVDVAGWQQESTFAES